MKIEIQGYRGAKVQTVQSKLTVCGGIFVCGVVINKKFVGSVMWDGEKLFIKTIQKEMK